MTTSNDGPYDQGYGDDPGFGTGAPTPSGDGSDLGTGTAPQPVAIAQAISALLLVLPTASWFALDNPVLNIIFTIIGIAGSVAATIKAHNSVIAIRTP